MPDRVDADNIQMMIAKIHQYASDSQISQIGDRKLDTEGRSYFRKSWRRLDFTFLANGDALISLRAFAPLSSASGSKRGPLLSDSQYATVPPAASAAARPAPSLSLLANTLAIGPIHTNGRTLDSSSEEVQG